MSSYKPKGFKVHTSMKIISEAKLIYYYCSKMMDKIDRTSGSYNFDGSTIDQERKETFRKTRKEGNCRE